MKARDIALAMTIYSYNAPFKYTRNIVVENVYWGWGLKYEADLIAISKAGYATEIEIKVSKYDLIKDMEKIKYTLCPDSRITRKYFAIPQELVNTAIKILPPNIGILSVYKKEGHDRYTVETIRRAVRNKLARPCTEQEINKLLRLQSIKYWDRLSAVIAQNQQLLKGSQNDTKD